MNNELITSLIEEVTRRALLETGVEVEASGRHVHLDRETVDALFGPGYELTHFRDLSQPGQYVCKERISIVGPKSVIHNVVILGPIRKKTQVEISATDGTALGIKAPVRESGDIAGTPGILLLSAKNSVQLSEGLIIAKRHIHMTPQDAEKQQVTQSEIVQVKINGDRPLIFDDVVVRISPDFATYMHIDYDEANACGFKKGIRGQIIKKTKAK